VGNLDCHGWEIRALHHLISSHLNLGHYRVLYSAAMKGGRSKAKRSAAAIDKLLENDDEESTRTNNGTKPKRSKTEDSADKAFAEQGKERERLIGFELRMAYCLNEPYPFSSGLKYIDKLMGNKGTDEGEIDNRKGLTKTKQIFFELEKIMADPNITFNGKYGGVNQHDWKTNLYVPEYKSKRGRYHPSFTINPDLPWTTKDDRPLRAITNTFNKFKKSYTTLTVNFSLIRCGGKLDVLIEIYLVQRL
jgi:hypothetical protein